MTFDEFWKNERMVATSYRNAAKAAWNEARRTDPVKAQMLGALKEIQQNIKELRQGTRGICDGELERIGYIAKQAIAEEES
jgi:hypothetical protein